MPFRTLSFYFITPQRVFSFVQPNEQLFLLKEGMGFLCSNLSSVLLCGGNKEHKRPVQERALVKIQTKTPFRTLSFYFITPQRVFSFVQPNEQLFLLKEGMGFLCSNLSSVLLCGGNKEHKRPVQERALVKIQTKTNKIFIQVLCSLGFRKH